MTEPATDVARRMRRDAHCARATTRFWAGWRLELTFGPYELAFDPERAATAKRTANEIWWKLHGRPAPSGPEAERASLESQRDLWHLSASWRGGHPVEEGRGLLRQLVAAIGVPEADREGSEFARVHAPDGRPSPQVTHWVWRDS